MIGNTLDRKAMLETGSDSSDPLRSHVSYDGPGITSVCVRCISVQLIVINFANWIIQLSLSMQAETTLPRDYHRRRRESEHDSDRSFGSLAVQPQYNFSPQQFMIPRVRNMTTSPSNQMHQHHHHQGPSTSSQHHYGGGGGRGHTSGGHNHRHHNHAHHAGAAGGGGGHHHAHGHNHHAHSHAGSSYDLHYMGEHSAGGGHNHRGHSYMW